MLNLQKLLTLTVEAKTNILVLDEIENILKQNILEQEAARKGNKNTYKVMMKLVNKYSDSTKPDIDGVWTGLNENYEECQYFCNGYFVIQINTIIDELPKVKGLVLGNMFLNTIEDCKTKVEIDMNEVRANYKISKAEAKGQGLDIKSKNEWSVKIHNSLVDPDFLIDICKVIGDDIEVYAPENISSPIYIKGKVGNAIILPIRYKK